MRRTLQIPVILGFAILISVLIYLRPTNLSQAEEAAKGMPIDWAAWQERCAVLPSNQFIEAKRERPAPSAISAIELKKKLDDFYAAHLKGPMAENGAWASGKPGADFFQTYADYSLSPPPKFQPFAQKLALPSSARVIFLGDLHGDVRSLLTSIVELQKRGIMEGFKIVDPKTHLVFLGDYTDRGHFGVEVIYTLLRLKLANPDNVWMARGNHEDFRLIDRYGFRAEMDRKFGSSFDQNKLIRLFHFLPAVIYIGTGGDYLQCNHGGMEPGYNAGELLAHKQATAFQLIGNLYQRRFLREHPEMFDGLVSSSRAVLKGELADFTPLNPGSPGIFGFMWNDLTVYGREPISYDRRRSWEYSKKATEVVLKANTFPEARVRAVFRAHQQSRVMTPLMRRIILSSGVFRHWQSADSAGLAKAPPAILKGVLDTGNVRSIPDGSVHTFNVSPDSLYGIHCNYGFATMGILSLAKEFKDWRLEVVTVTVPVD